MNPVVVKVIAKHALLIGSVAAAVTVARDVIVLTWNDPKEK